MDVKLSVEFLNQLCGYLGTRPFQEVAQFILTIQQAAKQLPLIEKETLE